MPVSPSFSPSIITTHIIRNELKLQFIWELFAITPLHGFFFYIFLLTVEHFVMYTICFSHHTTMFFKSNFYETFENVSFFVFCSVRFFSHYLIPRWFVFHVDRKPFYTLYSILPPHRNLLLVFMWLRQTFYQTMNSRRP